MTCMLGDNDNYDNGGGGGGDDDDDDDATRKTSLHCKQSMINCNV